MKEETRNTYQWKRDSRHIVSCLLERPRNERPATKHQLLEITEMHQEIRDGTREQGPRDQATRDELQIPLSNKTTQEKTRQQKTKTEDTN